MKVYEFTKPELEFYKHFCNFDEQELKLFELRSQNIPLEQCAEIMGYENIKRLSVRVNNKIIKMSNTKKMQEWINKVYWEEIFNNQ